MTPIEMAAIHAAAFAHDRAWTATEFTELLDTPHVCLIAHPNGFALTRTIAGESELLTIAVDPAFQRQGIAHSLMADWLTTLQTTADTAFLEVAAVNNAARALYAAFDFAQVATRTAYYKRKNAAAVDAFILRRDLTLGQTPDSPVPNPMSNPESG